MNFKVGQKIKFFGCSDTSTSCEKCSGCHHSRMSEAPYIGIICDPCSVYCGKDAVSIMLLCNNSRIDVQYEQVVCIEDERIQRMCSV